MTNIDDKQLENINGAGDPSDLQERPQAQANDRRMAPPKSEDPPRGHEDPETEGTADGGFSNPFQQ